MQSLFHLGVRVNSVRDAPPFRMGGLGVVTTLHAAAYVLAGGLVVLVGCGRDAAPTPGGSQASAALPTLPAAPTSRPLIDDPVQDGWQSEAFNDTTSRQLKPLEALLSAPATIQPDALRDVVTSDFTCTRLRPQEIHEAFRDEHYIVRRGRPADGEWLRGSEGFTSALRELAAALGPAIDLRVKLKVIRVQVPEEGAPGQTSAYFQAGATTPRGGVQINATWHLTWSAATAQGAPRLSRLEVEDYEEVQSRRAEGPRFADCTEAVLGKNTVFAEQLLPGIDHWTARIDQELGIDVGGWQGLAIGDVNADGLDDLYLLQPGGLPNRLFVQERDGTATERSAEAGIDWLEYSHGALLADLDNDGDQDLAVSIEAGVLIHSNDGRGRFTVRSAEVLPAAIPYSLAAADYDQDGDLDLYVCCYNPRRGINRHLVFARPVPYHDANNGGPNVLLQNDGAWRFTHATKRVGLDANNRRYSYAAAWEDFDNDGDLDLYVANDFGRNNLYRNDAGRFTDVAPQAGVEDISPGMSVAWGDYDNDGLADLYVANMFSSAGNRITHQPQFHAGAGGELLGHLRRHARGNSLFRNRGDGTFADVSSAAGVVLGRWAWGAKFFDLNNDGWQDLFVANGFITQEDPSDL
jgi:hypothetical protein